MHTTKLIKYINSLSKLHLRILRLASFLALVCVIGCSTSNAPNSNNTEVPYDSVILEEILSNSSHEYVYSMARKGHAVTLAANEAIGERLLAIAEPLAPRPVHYVWQGADPDVPISRIGCTAAAGLDCSGMIIYAL